MSEKKTEETTTVTPPQDDATIVHDDPVAADKKVRDELVAAVAKKLDKTGDTPKGATHGDQPPEGETQETKPEQSEQPGDKPEDTAHEGEDEKEPAPPEEAQPEEAQPSLSQELQARAEKAGISKDVAEQLHQAGSLEEVVAMSDRRMMQYVQAQSRESRESPKGHKADQTPKTDDEEVPALDPDEYDETLVKRDAYQQRRIEALEAQVQQLVHGSDDGFDQWFDGSVDALNRDDLFGNGTSVSRSKQSNRDALFDAYKAICAVYGVDPNDRDPQMTKFAFAAEFRDEYREQIKKQVKKEEKKKQQDQLDRTRDAQGKFLPRSNSRGGPPPKNATDEEVHEQLVSKVATLLKKRGISMSGV